VPLLGAPDADSSFRKGYGEILRPRRELSISIIAPGSRRTLHFTIPLKLWYARDDQVRANRRTQRIPNRNLANSIRPMNLAISRVFDLTAAFNISIVQPSAFQSNCRI
jgi:hypothetical protein